ncbi:unnamed protein product [Allacma fusca]|uniref:Helicase C-terminal domain-containing protein n=1 Tax=Allacma fusca TaxID=39272 RepID=A0A8J2K244_9HEXA|nr:unnamed protein product [Allacma fusca]
MFSATFPGGVQRAAHDFLNSYTFVAIGTVGGACHDIQQIVYKVDRYDKTNKLLEIMREIQLDEKIIIFCERKFNSVHLTTALSNFGFMATTLNSDMTQRDRELVLKEFSDGKYQIMVATGIASRGLDIARVSLVINYDLPECIEEYIQRIGRTGRIGNVGKAISFFQDIVDDPLRPKLQSALRNAGQEVPEWLLQECDLEEKSLHGSRFPATDFRRNQQGFLWSSVPAAVEMYEDGW